MKIWYYSDGDKKFGPFTAAELKKFGSDGTIQSHFLIGKDGTGKWIPAMQLNGLLPHTEPPVIRPKIDTPPIRAIGAAANKPPKEYLGRTPIKKYALPGLVLLVLAYVAAGPYIAIHKIKRAIVQQDSETLTDYIDFVTLRSNLKDQFNAVMAKKMNSDLDGNPFAVLAMTFASKLVDGMVDSMVTPTGLANIMEGNRPKLDKQAPPTTTNEHEKSESFKDARYSYDSLSKFSVHVPIDAHQETKILLTRDGLSWKLTNIVLPLN